MTNWRLLEAEIERAVIDMGLQCSRNANGDLIKNGLNLTELSRNLADRVELRAKPVQVKAEI